MRILVIGGSVFIGAAVVRRLLELGHDVTVLNRGRRKENVPPGVGHIAGDRARLADSAGDLRRLSPDVVLHNVVVVGDHARQCVDVLRGVAGRLVMTSSCDVYQAYGRISGREPGPPVALPLTEESPLRTVMYPYRTPETEPTHLSYDYDKIPAEQAVLSEPSLPGTVLRLPMVLGPGDYQHRLYSFVKPMQDGRPAIVLEEGYATWRSTYGFVHNVAAAMVLACTDPRAAGRTYNVGDWPLSTHELASAVARELGWKGEIVGAPAADIALELRAGMELSQDLVTSDARIRDELGYRERVDLDGAIRASVAWELEHPPDPAPPQPYEAVDAYLAKRGA
ncbi:MAG: NAD-dependent epimerase/dehydratase family protein [Acidobacteriota bacterium]